MIANCFIQSRFYHVSSAVFNLKRQGTKLCKLLNPRQKKKWHPTLSESAVMPTVQSLTKIEREPAKQGIKRVAVLNKLFMKHITDIMSTGTSSIEIVGRGIEISKVQISPDLQRVNVFWVCKGKGSDDETQLALDRVAGALRHELSALRAMGEVPYIVFVKDWQEARLVELDRRLAVADYGEDYEPTEIGEILKSQFALDMKLTPEMQMKIKQLEEIDYTNEDDPLPEMSHNVYGLEHDKIMNRLLAARKKTKDAWNKINDESVISYTVDSRQPKIDFKAEKKELAAFLQKRQIEQDKLYKQSRQLREDPIKFEPKNDVTQETELYDYDDDFIEEHEYEERPDDFYLQDSFGKIPR